MLAHCLEGSPAAGAAVAVAPTTQRRVEELQPRLQRQPSQASQALKTVWDAPFASTTARHALSCLPPRPMQPANHLSRLPPSGSLPDRPTLTCTPSPSCTCFISSSAFWLNANFNLKVAASMPLVLLHRHAAAGCWQPAGRPAHPLPAHRRGEGGDQRKQGWFAIGQVMVQRPAQSTGAIEWFQLAHFIRVVSLTGHVRNSGPCPRGTWP